MNVPMHRYWLALALAACGEDIGPTTELPPFDFDAHVNADGDPTPRQIDCDAVVAAYRSRCIDHLGISTDTLACVAIRDAQAAPGPLALSVGRAAVVCEQAARDCDRLFVCLADEQGLSALSTDTHVTGSAKVEGSSFTFDATAAYAWLGTKASGAPGDLAVLFTHRGRPWYFKLEDFAERAREVPFVVDALRPIKLENGDDNVEIPLGTVVVTTFEPGGAFDISADATDSATGERIDLRIQGSF